MKFVRQEDECRYWCHGLFSVSLPNSGGQSYEIYIRSFYVKFMFPVIKSFHKAYFLVSLSGFHVKIRKKIIEIIGKYEFM